MSSENDTIDFEAAYERINAAYEALVRDLRSCNIQYKRTDEESELVISLHLDKDEKSAKKSCIMQALKNIVM